MSEAALHFYWLLVIIVAVPSAPFNRVAAVVVAARIINQTTWALVPAAEPFAQAVVFGAAAVVAAWQWRTIPCLASSALFLPMSVASAAWAAGGIDPSVAWWLIVACGIVQIVILPLGNDWRAIKDGREAIRDMSWLDRLLRVPAWTS